MKPHVLLIEPMMPEAEAQLDAAYLQAPPVCGTRPRADMVGRFDGFVAKYIGRHARSGLYDSALEEDGFEPSVPSGDGSPLLDRKTLPV